MATCEVLDYAQQTCAKIRRLRTSAKRKFRKELLRNSYMRSKHAQNKEAQNFRKAEVPKRIAARFLIMRRNHAQHKKRVRKMIKIFLVEDEVVIRNGIKNSIEWQKEGYEFVGEAGDGELALPMILKEKPDILITDIRMPFMDGLELSRLVKKELPEIKILILSGYDDFGYAKEAIRIGVTDYLLKPISSAKLLENLSEISAQIMQERENVALQDAYRKERRENEELLKKKFFDELILGQYSPAEAIENGERFHMDLRAGAYRIVLFKLLVDNGTDYRQRQFLQAFEKIDTGVDDEKDICSVQRGAEGWAFLLTAQEDNIQERTAELVQKLESLMSEFPKINYFGGIGRSVLRVREISDSFRDADCAFSGRFTMPSNQIVSAQKATAVQVDGDFDAGSLGGLEPTRGATEKFLSSGLSEEVESFVKSLFSEFPEDYFQSLIMRQYFTMDIYVAILSFCEKLQGQECRAEEFFGEDAEQFKDAVLSAKSVEQIQLSIQRMLVRAIEYRNEVSGQHYSDVITAAKQQIEQSYMTEEIFLNTVAASVGMSPSYFSSVFSRQTGQTFIEYLTQVRMEHAKEYLACSSLKTSEIGFAVGYRDPHYFSYTFKKTQGCSPKEFRLTRKGQT